MEKGTRSAVVVASASGIGLASCRRLAAAGYTLCMVDFDEEKLAASAQVLRDAGATVETIIGDAADPSTASAFTELALSRFGRIDALACVAGGAGGIPMHQVDEIPLEQWEKVLRLNLTTTYLACHHIVPVMRDAAYGRIVCLSSTVSRGRLGPVGTMGARLAYATAKAGLLGFVRQLSKDVGEYGITVNAVLPWLTFGEPGTKIRESFYSQSQDYQARTLAMSPQKRPITADGVAAAITFLLSEEAGYISGVEMPVDGGVLN